MSGQLYGRAEAVALVGELMTRPGRGAAPHGRHCPVVVYEGPAGSGKTALLGGLAGLFNRRVPYAHVDADIVDATAGRPAVAQLLAAAAFQLARRNRRYGALRFPRLLVGQLIVQLALDPINRDAVMRLPVTDANRDKAAAEVTRALAAHRGVDGFTRALQEVAGEALRQLPGGGRVPSGLVARVLGFVAGRLTSWAPSRRFVLGRYQAWYGHQDDPARRQQATPDESIEELVMLYSWARHLEDPDSEQRINALLFQAFFADLRDAFQTKRSAGKWPLNCVVLLDNADSLLGTEFLTGLVEARRARVGGPGATDPLTVVAASRGELLASVPEADRETVRSVAPVHLDGHPWWVRWPLRSLTFDEVGAMVAALRLYDGNNRRLAGVLYHFTRGHPTGTQLLLDVIAEGGTGRVELADLLAKPRRDGTDRNGTVESVLCSRLLSGVPDDEVEDLVTCAAARDRTEAKRLVDGSKLVSVSDTRVNMWDSSSTLLRTLLLRRLARREAAPGGWTEVFDWLDNDDGDGRRLDYRLSANRNNLPEVVGALADQLSTMDIVGWLDLLHQVASAPRHPKDVKGTPTNQARTLLASVTPHNQQETVVAGLLAKLWVASSPLCGSDRSTLYSDISGCYDQLSRSRPMDSDELRPLVDQYRQWSVQWRPVRSTGVVGMTP